MTLPVFTFRFCRDIVTLWLLCLFANDVSWIELGFQVGLGFKTPPVPLGCYLEFLPVTVGLLAVTLGY